MPCLCQPSVSSSAVHEFRCVCGAAIAIPGRFSLVAQQPIRTLSAGLRVHVLLRTCTSLHRLAAMMICCVRAHDMPGPEQAGMGVAMICVCYFGTVQPGGRRALGRNYVGVHIGGLINFCGAFEGTWEFARLGWRSMCRGRQEQTTSLWQVSLGWPGWVVFRHGLHGWKRYQHTTHAQSFRRVTCMTVRDIHLF